MDFGGEAQRNNVTIASTVQNCKPYDAFVGIVKATIHALVVPLNLK